MTRRSPSPYAIRQQAALAYRNRMRMTAFASPPPVLRHPDDGETPLSPAEVRHGMERGLLRVPPFPVSPSANH